MKFSLLSFRRDVNHAFLDVMLATSEPRPRTLMMIQGNGISTSMNLLLYILLLLRT